MKESTKERFGGIGCLVLIAVPFLALWYFSPTGEERKAQEIAREKQRQVENEERKTQEEQQITQWKDILEKEFNATYFRTEGRMGELSGVYSYETQKELTALIGHTIVFEAYIKDVEMYGNDLLVEFVQGDFMPGPAYFVFRLVSSKNKFQDILAPRRKYFQFETFIVSAKVENVRLSRFVDNTLIDEKRTDLLDFADDKRFIITGQLIDYRLKTKEESLRQ